MASIPSIVSLLPVGSVFVTPDRFDALFSYRNLTDGSPIDHDSALERMCFALLSRIANTDSSVTLNFFAPTFVNNQVRSTANLTLTVDITEHPNAVAFTPIDISTYFGSSDGGGGGGSNIDPVQFLLPGQSEFAYQDRFSWSGYIYNEFPATNYDVYVIHNELDSLGQFISTTSSVYLGTYLSNTPFLGQHLETAGALWPGDNYPVDGMFRLVATVQGQDVIEVITEPFFIGRINTQDRVIALREGTTYEFFFPFNFHNFRVGIDTVSILADITEYDLIVTVNDNLTSFIVQPLLDIFTPDNPRYNSTDNLVYSRFTWQATDQNNGIVYTGIYYVYVLP